MVVLSVTLVVVTALFLGVVVRMLVLGVMGVIGALRDEQCPDCGRRMRVAVNHPVPRCLTCRHEGLLHPMHTLHGHHI